MDSLFGGGIDVPVAEDTSEVGQKRLRTPAGKSDRTKKKQDQYQELMSLVVKLSLSSALQVRMLRAIMIDCYMIPTESKWFTLHKQATVDYNAMAERLRKEGKAQEAVKNQIGLPHLHAFNAHVKHYVELKPQSAQEIQDYIKQWGSWQKVNKEIKHYRVTRTFHASNKRLEVSAPMIDRSPVQGSVTWMWGMIRQEILASPQTKEMQGIAPMGDLERQLQTWLDSNKD